MLGLGEMRKKVMIRTLVISDIHGCYQEFRELLELVKYKPKADKLILLGDLVDRGPGSKEVVEYVIKLSREENVIVLRGNHDQRFIDVMTYEGTEEELKFFDYGGLQAINSYQDNNDNDLPSERLKKVRHIIQSKYTHHITFLDSLPYFYEDQNHIFVHAGLNPNYKNWKEQPTRDFMYIKDPFIFAKTNVNKKVVFGHTKTFDIHGSPEIWFGDDKIGIDGGCVYGMQLNCLEMKGDQQYKEFSIPAKSQ
jgi:serine/threonine protein phosphatase 1